MHSSTGKCFVQAIESHEVLGFWDFYGILGFKVKMHHFDQPARRRVVRKSVECCDFCIFVESVVHRSNWRSRETETVGNSRKQSETVGNSWKQSGAARPDHAKIVNPHFFLQKNKLSAQSHFF